MVGNFFYQSKDWIITREKIINDRLNSNGEVICEYCNKPIYKKYDIILHHIIPLNEQNYKDVNIAFNPKNIQIVHHACHNRIHNNFKEQYKKIYVVYGAPLSGKTTFVNKNISNGDLIIDIERIWECISNTTHLAKKPNSLKPNVFQIRDILMDQVKHKVGFWNRCYIVGGFPLISERERIVNELNAELIYIDTDYATCIERANNIEREDVKKDYIEYINQWFLRANKS